MKLLWINILLTISISHAQEKTVCLNLLEKATAFGKTHYSPLTVCQDYLDFRIKRCYIKTETNKQTIFCSSLKEKLLTGQWIRKDK